MTSFMLFISVLLASARLAHAHFAAWALGMYCLNGTQKGFDDQNNNAPVNPLFNLSREDWWFHHVNGCDEFPPMKATFWKCEPANSEFTVELAVNRAFTTLSYGGDNIARFGDGDDHDEFDQLAKQGKLTTCIGNPNIHTQNESMAAGTIFAISYNSDLTKITEDNLVVFSVLPHTPWFRLATYEVPNLPACPDDGCTCAWGWVANGCGEPNFYMQGFKCKVVGNTGGARLATAKPAAWCEDDTSKCVSGAKQMIFYNAIDGNNVNVSGYDLSGSPRSPTYNSKMGFSNGRQTDIFDEDGTATTTSITPTSTSFGPPNPDDDDDSGAAALSDILRQTSRYLSMLFLLPFFFG
ncbi:hypothetical protein BDZ89DRAFT_951496 [Hymenopellis radicata]|nr:hypothetical protein BDZ89DRAFT_951496 [Hymenopellis radicata]